MTDPTTLTAETLTAEDLEDLIAEALQDSMDVDWSSRIGARYVVEALTRAGALSAQGPSPAPERGESGWGEAVIAWSVCASIHREFGRGRDALFKTRQADFVKREADARAAFESAPAPLTQPTDGVVERWVGGPLANGVWRAFEAWWGKIARQGDPLRRPNLTTEAFGEGWNAALAVTPPVAPSAEDIALWKAHGVAPADMLTMVGLIVHHIEEVEGWDKSPALITARAHASVLAQDLPAALAVSAAPLHGGGV